MRQFLCAVLVLAGCKKPPEPVVTAPMTPARVEPVGIYDRDAMFWSWVLTHVGELKGVKTGNEPVLQELALELQKVDPGLVFELGAGNGVLEVIISADGKRGLFPVVAKLVDAAPPLPGMKVVALRPRKAMDEFSMQVGDRTLSGKDLWFLASEDPKKKRRLALQVFVVGMTAAEDDALEDAAFMMLEGTVGELALETKIGDVQFKPAPQKLVPPLKPLKELPATVDAWK